MEDTDWRFFPYFMPICSVTKKNDAIVYTRYKNTNVFAAILRPFGPGHQKNLTLEIWVRST